MKKRFGLKALAVLLTAMMLSALLPITALADPETTYIGITSDVHGSYTNISTWLSNNDDDGSLAYMVFGGDMGSVYWKTSATELGTISTNASYASDGDQTVGKINDFMDAQYPDTTPIYTMGNHDWYIGSYNSYTNADTVSFEPITGSDRTGIQNDPDDDGFTIYTLGAANGNTGDGTAYPFLESDIDNLETALAAADEGKPFFIISHFPLHHGSSRKGQNSSELIDLLNNYPNVFFFWGHNHHSVESLLDTIKVAGETIVPSDATGTTKTLNFTYANSSHMGSGDSVNGTGVFIEITDNGDSSSVTLTYKSMSGSSVGSPTTVDLGAAGNEIAAVSVTGITSPAAGAAPDTEAVVSAAGVTASAVSWFTGGTPFTGSAFVEGVAYTAQVTLTATGSRVFTASTTAAVNGEEATSVTLNLDGTFDVTYDFPQAAEPSLTYTKVSSVSSGHQYAIVTDGIAMNNILQTGSTSYYSYVGLGYTAPVISSDGNTLTFASADDAEAATWVFETTGNVDEWVISNEGSYLYAPQSRSLELDSENSTPWIFGTLEGSSQLYSTLNDDANDETITCKLFYGGTSTVNFFYPSVNNDSTLVLYEKSSSTPTPTVDYIAITNPPAKTAYTAGETFDAAGMQVTAYYFDSTSAAVTGYSVSPDGTLSVSDTAITVTYQGETASQTITVSPAVLFIYKKAAAITDGHEYALILGDVAMSNAAMTGTYNSNEYTGLSSVTPTVNGDYLIFGSAADVSSATWTLSADGSGWDIQNGAQYVNATANRTMSLGAAQAWTYGTLSGKGTQFSVVLGSSTYNLFYGGTTTVDFIYPSANNSNTLTLYEKQSAALTGIEITTPPDKTTYSAGESFDAAGMVVTALFGDGSSEIVTDYTVLPSGALAVTDSLVTVSFLRKTAAQPVDVFPAGSTTYTLADTIEAGAKYVIVSNLDGTNKALQNSVASTNYLASPAVTVSGDAVTSSVSSDMIWTAETGSTGGMLFQNGGKYLTRGSSASSGYGLVSGSKPSDTLGDWKYESKQLYIISGSNKKNYLHISSQGYFRVSTSIDSAESIYLYKQNIAPITLENITAAGAQTSYTEGQAFDPTGMVVTAHFSDGSSHTITNYIYSPSGVLSTENTRVTIVYHGKTAIIDITVAAVPVYYTVTWLNGTARLEQDTGMPAGAAPSYNGSEPAKSATAQYTYSFAGWNTDPYAVTGTPEADLPAVSGNVTYYAVFTETLNRYTVTYAPGAHGTFTAQVTENLIYGDSTPAAPIVAGQSGWSFAGWNTTPTATVTKTVTYTATWTQDTYTVTYAPGTYGVFLPQATENLIYGDSTPAAPIVIGQSGWSFAGWNTTPTATVTKTVTYTATWTQDKYTVTYAPGAYGTFTAQATDNLIYGDATPAAPTVTGSSGWSFAGWDSTPAATVTKNVTYTATWTQDSNPEVYAGYSGAASVEGAESGKKISLTLTNGQFSSSISARQFALTGLPAGVRKGAVKKVSDSVVTIALLGNSTVDYDEDITVQIVIGKSQIQPTPEDDITVYVTMAATVEPLPAAPTSATFSYSGSYANRLRGVTSAMEYSLDGGVSYTSCKSTSVTLRSAQLNSLDADKDILVRYKATQRVPAGIPQVIDLRKGADIPADVVFSDEANTLTGMSTSMELSVNSGNTWTKYTGSNLPGLVGDVTIMVRYAAFNAIAAGTPVTFKFTSSNPLLSIAAVNNGIIEGAESGKTITVTLTNGTFASSLSTRKISLNGLPAGVKLGSVKRTSATVATLTLSGNSTVDYDSDLGVTVSFDKSLFVPTQQANLTDTFTIAAAVETSPAAPTTAAFTFSGTYANKLRGVTTAMEYSLDGGVSYTACKSTAVTLRSAELNSLDAGKDILVRYKSSLRANAGDDQLIDLLEGDNLPDTVQGDDTANKMSGMVKSTMEYSTNGRTWTKYTGTLPNLTGNLIISVRMCAHDNDLPGEAESFVFTRKFFLVFWSWYK